MLPKLPMVVNTKYFQPISLWDGHLYEKVGKAIKIHLLGSNIVPSSSWFMLPGWLAGGLAKPRSNVGAIALILM